MGLSEKLEAFEEIKQLKARYCRAIDTKDWNLFESLWTDDSVLNGSSEDHIFSRKPRSFYDALLPAGASRIPEDVMAGKGVMNGAAIIRANCELYVGGPVRTCHYAFMPELELLSPDSARGIWSQQDVLDWPDDDGPFKTMHGYGWYHETYVRKNGRWHIHVMNLVRQRVDLT